MTGKMRKIFEKLPEALPPIILIISSIFLFGPYTIYSGNFEELSVSFPAILIQLILPTMILLACLYVVDRLLPKRFRTRYLSILFVVGVLLWFQGNILVWRYGLLDGQAFDWSEGQWRGLVDGALWAGGLTVGVLAYRGMAKNAKTASIALILLQTVLLGYSSLQQPQIWLGQSNGAWRSASKRATTERVSMPSLMTFRATRRWTGSCCSAT